MTLFRRELEFVQCLANPKYLNWLAQEGFFNQPEFINYLEYLQYWNEPQYSCFITYPHCLFFLKLLQNDNFRKEIAKPQTCEFICNEQFNTWKNNNN
jgi:mediator of RNA polymerase II transcription subunit 31